MILIQLVGDSRQKVGSTVHMHFGFLSHFSAKDGEH